MKSASPVIQFHRVSSVRASYRSADRTFWVDLILNENEDTPEVTFFFNTALAAQNFAERVNGQYGPGFASLSVQD